MAGEQEARARMVDETVAARGVGDPRVLAAMRKVERHRFVPASQLARAYADAALPIGHDATISQPYVVALMTELAALKAGDRALEIGTGSGYQAAVLAELGAEVFSIERVGALAERARECLREAGYASVRVRHGDGYVGWPEQAPFQAIVLTAAPPELPRALLDQLALGGRLIAPVGEGRVQSLIVVVRGEHGPIEKQVCDVMFVPMLPGLREA
ncbi:protein-L-isoaspartate(D-aspartate) O-methyltransferase [Nannocystaceae bacterium ST9]